MSPPGEVSVRLAKVEEFERISEIAQKSFIQDPVFNYFGSVTNLLQRDVASRGSENLKKFLAFVLWACYMTGGRITVVVKQPEGGNTEEDNEKVVGAALWLPPNKRLALWKVITLMRCGVIPVLWRWGLTALIRIGFEFLDAAHAALVSAYKTKGVKESPDASWYLQLVMTDPAYEDQGFMSLLMREAYAHSPSTVFTLEATTAKSRDRYQHLGFELLAPIKLGVGKVNAEGLSSSGEDAVGVECYSMANWNPGQ